MKITTLLASVLIAGFVLPAAAQTEEYYVVQGVKTRTCTVTRERPKGTEYTVVSPNGVVYKTEVEAKNAMKTIRECHTE
ncbi:MAG TPA: hypothetical protein VJ770_11220 [Stellaceae bacterium]|nr:hypothetical protein [Stellaceae bacterium]